MERLARPALGLPGGEVVVASAEDCFRTGVREGGCQSTIEKDIVFSDALAEGGEDLVGEFYFVFVDLPLAETGVGFRKKDDVQIEIVAGGERVEDRDAIGGDDLGDERETALHWRHSW